MELGIRITLEKPDDFLLVKETLTRVGVASNRTKTLYQSAHIFHRRGEYYIMHFKELFKLDGKPTNISEEDYDRRNLIASLLKDWGLVKILEPAKVEKKSPTSSIKILSFKDKDQWQCVAKYSIGNNY